MYSRRQTIEEKKNRRKAFILIILTVVSLFLIFFYGLPLIAKFATFLSDLRGSSEVAERNDTTPPPPPRLDILPEATSEISVEITGTTEEGAIVTLFLNSNEEEVIANKEGRFSYKFSLNKGGNRIAARARDSSGNESQETDTIVVIQDSEPPSLEITSPEDGSEFFSSSQRQVVIEGKTEEGTSVQINDRLVVVEASGDFTFATTLGEGENTFNVKAQDKAGNINEESITLHFSP